LCPHLHDLAEAKRLETVAMPGDRAEHPSGARADMAVFRKS
jgi:hypothetical protein